MVYYITIENNNHHTGGNNKMTNEMKMVVEMIASMTNDEQHTFYNNLSDQGLSETELDVIKAQVTFWKMQNVPGFMDAIMEEMGTRLYNELRA